MKTHFTVVAVAYTDVAVVVVFFRIIQFHIFFCFVEAKAWIEME